MDDTLGSKHEDEGTTVSEPAEDSPQSPVADSSVPTAESSEPTNNHVSETSAEQDAPPCEEQNSRDEVKLRNPTSPPATTSGSTSQISLELTPRPQSYIIQGSATLPIRGPLRPLSTAFTGDDAPNEQFDNLYDTLPAELRNKKQKPKVEKIEPLPPIPVKPIEEEEQIVESPIEKIADRDDERVYKMSSIDPLLVEHPNNHRILTIVSMVLCGVLLNIFAFFCLIPALIFSIKSKSVALDGEWNKAMEYARRTLILNLIAIIGSIVGILAIFIIIQIIFGVAVY